MMNRREMITALAASASAPASLLAEFTIPARPLGLSAEDKRPRAIVFTSRGRCLPCDQLRLDVYRGKWSEFRWEFATEGSSAFADWRTKYRGRIESFPHIYWPDSGANGFKVEGYRLASIRGVITWHTNAKKATSRRAKYRTRSSNWTWPGTSYASLLTHCFDSHWRLSPGWLRELSFEELKAAHSDDHERAKVRR